jgi:hypothetical protein
LRVHFLKNEQPGFYTTRGLKIAKNRRISGERALQHPQLIFKQMYPQGTHHHHPPYALSKGQIKRTQPQDGDTNRANWARWLFLVSWQISQKTRDLASAFNSTPQKTARTLGTNIIPAPKPDNKRIGRVPVSSREVSWGGPRSYLKTASPGFSPQARQPLAGSVRGVFACRPGEMLSSPSRRREKKLLFGHQTTHKRAKKTMD